MGFFSKFVKASSGASLAFALQIVKTPNGGAGTKKAILNVESKKSVLAAITTVRQKTRSRISSQNMEKRSKELPPEEVDQIRNITGLGPMDGKTPQMAAEECEAAWLHCAMNSCADDVGSGGQNATCPALVSRVVPKSAIMDPTKCPNVAALVDHGILLEEELPSHLSAEEYKMGCMCINSPDGCPPPPYYGPVETCEAAWSACSMMEMDEEHRKNDEITKETGLHHGTCLMMAIETGFLDPETLPPVIAKADYVAGCVALLENPPWEDYEHVGSADPTPYADGAVSLHNKDHMPPPPPEGIPRPDSICYSIWDQCMWDMGVLHEFALPPGGNHSPPAYPPPTGNFTAMIEKTKKLASSKYLHRYRKSIGLSNLRNGSAMGNSSAHIDPVTGFPLPGFHEPSVPFTDLSDYTESPDCHGLLLFLHDKAVEMTPEELVKIPHGLNSTTFVHDICLPEIGAATSHREPTEEDDACRECQKGCGAETLPLHHEIDGTDACYACHQCDNAPFTGCESLFGYDDPQCHKECADTYECKECASKHAGVIVDPAVSMKVDNCMGHCHSTVCAKDGTLDHEVNYLQPRDMAECHECHESCDDHDCHLMCMDVCALAKNNDLHAHAERPIEWTNGTHLPQIGYERGATSEMSRADEAAAASLPAPVDVNGTGMP